MKKYAIIVAGGSGSRMKSDIPKQFLLLQNQPVLMHTIQNFAQIENIKIILVLPQNQIDTWKNLCQKFYFEIPLTLVCGGETRIQSVKNGLNVIEDKQSLVAIHDGVRPFVQKQVIEKSFEIAKDKGNAITVIKLKDSIRQKTYAENTKSVDRNDFYLVQTPQTFHTSLIFEAYQQENINHLTDDASVLENYGHPINVIEGSYENIKITTPEDMLVANAFYENLKYHHKKI